MLRNAAEFFHGQADEASGIEKTIGLAKNAATVAVAAFFTYEYVPMIRRFVAERINGDSQNV